MRKTFSVIEDYNVLLYEEYKVRQLLDKINSLNKDLKTEVNIYISSHSDSFNIDSTYISTVILRLFLETETSLVIFRCRRQFNSDGIGVIGGRGNIF